MAKRCLIVTYYFPPVGGGGVQRIAKLIKYLSRDDWQFSVVTSSESSSNLPLDENLAKDIPANVVVYKVANPLISKDESLTGHIISFIKSTFFVRWISSFVFIPDIHKKWILCAKKKVQLLLKKENFDIVLVSSPPYSLSILAAELTKTIPIPVVLDMRDPWITNPYKIHPTKWHYRKDRKIEFNTIKDIKYGTSAYVSLIEFYKKNITNFQAENWRFIPNGFDEEDFNLLKPEKFEDNKLNIVFSGTFYSHINNPKVLFKAIASLNKKLKEKIIFHHIGTSNIALKKLANNFSLSANVKEWGYRSHEDCINILAGMNVCCLILDSLNPNAINTIGGKVYEYLRLGKPILALVPLTGEAADLINGLNAGIVIDPHDVKNISNILQKWIIERPKENSIKKQEFERSTLALKYSDFFNQIITNNQN